MTNPSYIPNSAISITLDGESVPSEFADKLRNGLLKLKGNEIVIIVQLGSGSEDIAVKEVKFPTKLNIFKPKIEAKSTTVSRFEDPEVSFYCHILQDTHEFMHHMQRSEESLIMLVMLL